MRTDLVHNVGMRIAIDISQIVYEGTGVGRYVREVVKALVASDQTNEYVLFGSSLRKKHVFYSFFEKINTLHPKLKLVVLPIPPAVLDVLWNRLHILPAEWFVGDIDVFWSSDWTQPPLTSAIGVTTIHDLSFMKYPQNFDNIILSVQKRRLYRAKEECRMFFCDSITTQKDVIEMLGIDKKYLRVVYPGFSTGEHIL